MSLSKDEIETIRIHMSAFKELLCNQKRWNEAKKYQHIVDELETLLIADEVIPVEWILNWVLKKHGTDYHTWDGAIGIMIREWEREQGYD